MARISSAAYERHKARARERSKKLAMAGREIGAIPPVANPRRRARCKNDLQAFCKTYFPNIFHLPWSKNHIEAIRRVERAAMHGGLFAIAMPRGQGKTAIARAATLWAILYGHRRFVFFIAATADDSNTAFQSIKMALESNEAITADFPEVCHPIQKLEGICNRSKGQLCEGRRTHITWSAKKIVLPTVEGSESSGAVVMQSSVTGSIRGKNHTTAAGDNIRPDFVVIDDPQKTEAAISVDRVKKLKKIVDGDILGLSGPTEKITAIMPCTVVAPNDLADQMLDPALSPDWVGLKTRLIDSMPENTQLWDEYRVIRAESLRTRKDISEATEFYRQNRAAMDKGAVVTWRERFEADEISAVQYAMNIYIQRPEAFHAEYQNEPKVSEDQIFQLKEDEIISRLNNLPRGVVPQDTAHITCFIDCQKDALFYMVCAVEENFTGSIIDYGTFPEQRERHFNIRSLNRKLSDLFPKAPGEAVLYSALEMLVERIMGNSWTREDGIRMSVSLCFIDSGWLPDPVFLFCRKSRYAALLCPSRGVGIVPSAKPISEYRRVPGVQIGNEWYVPSPDQKRTIRTIRYDTNYWKTQVVQRLQTIKGAAGAFYLYGEKPEHHRLLAEHLTAERFEVTAGRGRIVNVWRAIQHRDNHWLDCLVGCMVAADVRGCSVTKHLDNRRSRHAPVGGIAPMDLIKDRRETAPEKDISAVKPQKIKKKRVFVAKRRI